jgi:hypothetical protein
LNTYLKSLKNNVALLLSLLLFSSLSSITMVRGEEGAEVAGFNLQSYAPARILISYTYTNNFSVTDVSSIGKSLYKVISGPTSIEFQAQDIDQYTFTVEIKYAAIVTQSVQIAVFSAGYAPEGMQLNVKGNVVRLKFTLTVTEEPRYPSAQDVAEQVVLQVANQLNEFRRQTTDILDVHTKNIEMQWLIVGFTMAVSVAFVVILVFWVYPQLRRLQKERAY